MGTYGCIYKITNIVNNKIYIRQTKRDIKVRFRQHIYDSHCKNKNKYPINNAINKYGKHNFIINKLCSCCNANELNNMEAFYIKKYNVLKRNIGYNCKIDKQPGTLCQQSRNKISKSLLGRKYSKETIQKMKQSNKCNTQEVKKILRDRKKKYMIPIKLIDKNIIFECIKDAERWIKNFNPKASKSAIIGNLKGKRKSAYNYRWEYVNAYNSN